MSSVAVASRSFSHHPVLRAELLRTYPNAVFHDGERSLAGAELVRFLSGHSKAIIALESVTQHTLDQLPALRIISKYGVGLDKLDLSAMERNGVRLGWTPGVNCESVAELALAFAIQLRHQVPVALKSVGDGEWRQIRGRQLSGCVVGIIGCGHVGKALVRLLKPFGCRLLVHDLKRYPDFYLEHAVTAVPLDQLLTEADVVSLHVPLDDSTRGLLGARQLDLMRREAFVINTARGGIVDEQALAERLQAGRLAGAALDVFACEPPGDSPLLHLPTVMVTPHIGGSTEEAVLAMGRAAIVGLSDARLPSEYKDLERQVQRVLPR